MEGDGFSDPRHRAARRPRGGTRGRGRGFQQRGHHHRGSRKAPGTTRKTRPAPDLGSNEYRFRANEDEEEENAYDAGVDFEEAASQPMFDPSSSTDFKKVDLSDELTADFSNLDAVLAGVPLWVRLGDHARFALGIPEEDKIEDYLDPLPVEHSIRDDLSSSKNEATDEFLKDLAGLSFEEDCSTTGERQSQTDLKGSSEPQTKNSGEVQLCVAPDRGAQQSVSSSQPEERDDFDKWLDEL